jgi:hypothetical protein
MNPAQLAAAALQPPPFERNPKSDEADAEKR